MRLLPRTEPFFDHYEEEAQLLVGAVDELVAMIGRDADETKNAANDDEARAQRVFIHETRCQEITQRVIVALRATFLTPLDRDDLLALVIALQRVSSALADAAYAIATAGGPESLRPLAEATQATVYALADAVAGMRDAKHRDAARQRCDAAREASLVAQDQTRVSLRTLLGATPQSLAHVTACQAVSAVAARAAEAVSAIEAALLDA